MSCESEPLELKLSRLWRTASRREQVGRWEKSSHGLHSLHCCANRCALGAALGCDGRIYCGGLKKTATVSNSQHMPRATRHSPFATCQVYFFGRESFSAFFPRNPRCTVRLAECPLHHARADTERLQRHAAGRLRSSAAQVATSSKEFLQKF